MTTSAPPEPAAEPAAAPRRRRRMPRWLELVLIVVIALVLAGVTKTFFMQSFFVPSGSMRPLLHGSALTENDDRIVVEKVSYWNGDVHRGDVVVFDDSQDWLGLSSTTTDSGPLQTSLETVGLWPTGGHLVKRVIGLPGDDVACCDTDGRVSVNGVALDETDYLPKGAQPSQLPFTVTVPAGHLWVMGDNRQNSEDSRAHIQEPGGGFVPVDDVVGKVWAIVWPADRVGLVHRPDTFDNPDLDD